MVNHLLKKRFINTQKKLVAFKALDFIFFPTYPVKYCKKKKPNKPKPLAQTQTLEAPKTTHLSIIQPLEHMISRFSLLVTNQR